MLNKQTLKNALWTGAALALIPAAIGYTKNAIENKPAPQVWAEEQPAPLVTIENISAQDYRSVVSVFGEVSALENTSLSAQVSGRVVWRNPAFVDGGMVKKGDVLVKLDDTDYQAELADAEKALAEATLELEQEERQYQQAKKNWQLSGLTDTPSALTLREPQRKVAQSKVDSALKLVEKAKRNLKQTQIQAPFNAVVIEPNVAMGAYLQTGSAIATLRSSSKAEITVNLDDKQWQQLATAPSDNLAVVESIDGSGIQWEARVERFASSVDPVTRQRAVVVSVERPLEQETPLLFGRFVQVNIQGRQNQDLLAVPDFSYTADGYIWLVEDNKLQRVAASPRFSADGKYYFARNQLPQQIKLVRKPMNSYLPGTVVTTRIAGESN